MMVSEVDESDHCINRSVVGHARDRPEEDFLGEIPVFTESRIGSFDFHRRKKAVTFEEFLARFAGSSPGTVEQVIKNLGYAGFIREREDGRYVWVELLAWC